MIQFFRQNNFLTAFLLIPYTFIVRMACFYFNEAPETLSTGGVLYTVFAQAFEGRNLLANITINLVIAFTAILVNRSVIMHRLTRYQTLIPGLVYIFMVSWLELFLHFTAVHIANFFIMIGVLSLFKYSKKTSYSIVVFDGCFYFALAALFYTPYVIYLIPAILGYMSLNRFQFRELLNAIIGILAPYFIVSGMIYFFKGDFTIFDGYGINKDIFTWFGDLSFIDLIPLILYALILAITIFNYPSFVKKTTIVVQKKVNILYWLLLASFFTIFFINEKNVINLLVLALPTSVLFGMVLERSKAPAIEEFVHIVVLGGVLFLHFNQNFNILM